MVTSTSVCACTMALVTNSLVSSTATSAKRIKLPALEGMFDEPAAHRRRASLRRQQQRLTRLLAHGHLPRLSPGQGGSEAAGRFRRIRSPAQRVQVSPRWQPSSQVSAAVVARARAMSFALVSGWDARRATRSQSASQAPPRDCGRPTTLLERRHRLGQRQGWGPSSSPVGERAAGSTPAARDTFGLGRVPQPTGTADHHGKAPLSDLADGRRGGSCSSGGRCPALASLRVR